MFLNILGDVFPYAQLLRCVCTCVHLYENVCMCTCVRVYTALCVRVSRVFTCMCVHGPLLSHQGPLRCSSDTHSGRNILEGAPTKESAQDCEAAYAATK